MNESIYGVSSKYGYGSWDHDVYIFDNANEAQEWLHTEEYDFREREICDRVRAMEIAGTDAVEDEEETRMNTEWMHERYSVVAGLKNAI